MSNIVNCHNLSKSFGHEPLFSEISLGIFERDRVGIIGPNGSGKSTLLKIIAGEVQPDEGTVSVKKGSKLVFVAQQSQFSDAMSVEDVLRASFSARKLNPDDYQLEIDKALRKVGFVDNHQVVQSLSGGWKKRLSFACALAQEPDLLLLDEPTNHLDLEGILWLENMLKGADFAVAVISHDRYFLESACTRILEVNRVYPNGIYSSEGTYSQFLTLKAEFLSGQQQQQASLANKVRREVEWLQRGAKARSTKQQARIQSAEEMQVQLAKLNSRLSQGQANIEFNASQRKTKKLVTLNKVTKVLGDRTILSNLDLVLTQGLKLGLLGLNASGKTTLLKIIANKLAVDSGSVERADKLKIVYFDQNRELLNPELSLKKTLAPDSDSVVVNDRAIHVVSWAKKFLFRPEQLETPIKKLSGGEQARVQIAKLMQEPADVLLLDEPTNDLDIPTLEVLEESLNEFSGAVVLVTHDRFMLDRVSNVLLALDGKGKAEIFADYAQWQSLQSPRKTKDNAAPKATKENTRQSTSSNSKKLSFKEQKELEQMEVAIELAEKNLAVAQAELDDPQVASDSQRLQAACNALNDAQHQIEHLYTRWAELEAKAK